VSVPPQELRRHIARLAPLLPQLGIALRRRRGEMPDALKQAGGLGELAERMDMSLAHASLVVGDLAGTGLVDREHDERDRRRIIVSLSDAARPAVAQMRNRHGPALARFLSGLDDDEAEHFIDQLSRLVACLREE
jgi:DNA-binding MarR family transcriptional regulator